MERLVRDDDRAQVGLGLRDDARAIRRVGRSGRQRVLAELPRLRDPFLEFAQVAQCDPRLDVGFCSWAAPD
jgi:hypothetical protein